MPIALTKADGPADLPGITRIQVGVKWDPSTGNSGRFVGALRKRKGVDLDLIAVAMRGGDPVRLAGLDSLDPFDNGGLTHSGDAFTGAASGDDETADLDFSKVPNIVTSVVFTASAFKRGNTFSAARNIAFTVYDASDGKPGAIAEVWPSLLGTHNICAVCRAYRVGDEWKFEALGESGDFGKITQGDDQSLMKFAAKYAYTG